MARRAEYLDYIAEGGIMDNLPLPVAPEDNGLYKMAVGGFGMEKSKGFYRCKIHNANGGQYNFIGSFLDLGTIDATSAKVRAVVTVREESGVTKLPAKLGLRLFANNNQEREIVVGGYVAGNDGLIQTTAKDTMYTLEATFNNEPGAGIGIATTGTLNQYQYLKPFITITNTVSGVEKQLIDVHELTVEVGDTIYDVTDSVFNFQEGVDSDFKYIKAEIPTYSIARRKMPFFNKKVVALGDSITFGYDSANNGARLANPWVTQLREKCGFLNSRNNGISSSTVATKAGDSDWDTQRNPMVNRVAGLDKNADVVIFMGGVNDHTQNVVIGEVKAENVDTNTYFGAVNKTLADLSKTYADKIVIAMSPMDYVAGATASHIVEGKNTNGNTVADYREAMKSACEMNNVLYFDLNSAVGFNANNAEDVKLYFTDADKLHPNQAGHNKIADAISKYLLSLV